MNNDDHQVYFFGNGNRKIVMLSVCFWTMISCVILTCLVSPFMIPIAFMQAFFYAGWWDKCMREVVKEGKNVTLLEVWPALLVCFLFTSYAWFFTTYFDMYYSISMDIFYNAGEKSYPDKLLEYSQSYQGAILSISAAIVVLSCGFLPILVYTSMRKKRKELEENRGRYEESIEKVLQDGERVAGILQREGD